MATTLALAAPCALASPCAAVALDGAERIECFSIAQTRQKIAAHHLLDPFLALQRARSLESGEPISERLCETAGAFVYEVVLLRFDGRAIRVHIDATPGGRPHATPTEHPNAKGE